MKSKPKWENIEGRVNLAGVQFSDYQRLSASVLKPSLILKLVWERNNPHDNKAIRVEHAGISLGYIPRNTIHQSELHNAHKNGYKCIAVLTAFNKNNPTWCMITVQVKRCIVEGKKVNVPEEIEL